MRSDVAGPNRQVSANPPAPNAQPPDEALIGR
jgi:hypothetical protein